MEDGKYSDTAFIDAMIPHQESAIEMAQVAYRHSDNPKIKELAGNIVSAQQREIEHYAAVAASLVPGGISITFSTGPYDR